MKTTRYVEPQIEFGPHSKATFIKFYMKTSHTLWTKGSIKDNLCVVKSQLFFSLPLYTGAK